MTTDCEFSLFIPKMNHQGI